MIKYEDECPLCGTFYETDERGNSYCPARHSVRVVGEKDPDPDPFGWLNASIEREALKEKEIHNMMDAAFYAAEVFDDHPPKGGKEEKKNE